MMTDRRRLMMACIQRGSLAPIFYDRLVFDGAVGLDTGIQLAQHLSFRVGAGDETSKTGGQWIFCASGGGYTTGFILGGGTSASQRQMVPFKGSTSYLRANTYLGFQYPRYSLFMTDVRYGWGGSANIYSSTPEQGVPSGTLRLGCNGADANEFYTGALEPFYIYDTNASQCITLAQLESYTPLYTLRPCTFDGKAGMWIVETDTFIGNTIGTGTLSVANNI